MRVERLRVQGLRGLGCRCRAKLGFDAVAG